ncbi:hypothetical protein FRC02_002109 [Tulasnella sp. 418]|nr:hypothetical protein FRC02_002109 [Tulasnella sp. 418]
MSNPVSPEVSAQAGVNRAILQASVEKAPSQQAATAPGSGTVVGDPDSKAGKLPFKEQVKAYAHVSRVDDLQNTLLD